MTRRVTQSRDQSRGSAKLTVSSTSLGRRIFAWSLSRIVSLHPTTVGVRRCRLALKIDDNSSSAPITHPAVDPIAIRHHAPPWADATGGSRFI